MSGSYPGYQTTDRVDVSRPLMLERILRAWELRPEASLCDLLAGALAERAGLGPKERAAVRLMSDAELVEALERAALLGR